jgi:hypothetical protein
MPPPWLQQLTKDKIATVSRRGDGPLRQLVLLCNAFDGLSSLSHHQAEEDERIQRQEEERRWFADVFEQMVDGDGTGDGTLDDEGYVNLRYRDRDPDDCGYCETVQDAYHDRYSDTSIELVTSRGVVVKEDADQDQFDHSTAPEDGSTPSLTPDDSLEFPFERDSLPLMQDGDVDGLPPIEPPPLTPDSSPPGPGPASAFLRGTFLAPKFSELSLNSIAVDDVDSSVVQGDRWTLEHSSSSQALAVVRWTRGPRFWWDRQSVKLASSARSRSLPPSRAPPPWFAPPDLDAVDFGPPFVGGRRIRDDLDEFSRQQRRGVGTSRVVESLTLAGD